MAFGDKLKEFWDKLTPWDTKREQAAAAETIKPITDVDYTGVMEGAKEEASQRYQPLYDKISEIESRAQDIPTFEEWMNQSGQGLTDVTGTQEYQALGDLVNRLQAGPTSTDYEAARAEAAQTFGLTPEATQNLLETLTTGLSEGITGTEGMSAEERALRERQNRTNLQEAENRAKRLVQDTLANTGSTARALQTADQATMQINNLQLSQDAQLAQDKFERQVAQFESQKQVWQQMLQTQQIGVSEYMNNLQTSMGMALQGYAQQITTMFQQNQEVFQQYQADRDAVVGQIQAMYSAAQLELGVTEAEIQTMSDLYSAQIQPLIDQTTASLQAAEIADQPQGYFDWAITTLVDLLPLLAMV